MSSSSPSFVVGSTISSLSSSVLGLVNALSAAMKKWDKILSVVIIATLHVYTTISANTHFSDFLRLMVYFE